MHGTSNHGSVVAVCKKAAPGLPKLEVDAIELIEHYGVAGDYHAGKFVRHRYLARKNPRKPNLRQVLLIDRAILADLARQNIYLNPGMLGENIVVEGLTIMDLTVGTQLAIGTTLLEMTEVRNPCQQLNEMHPQLLQAVVRKVNGQPRPNAGFMVRIRAGGWVRPGDVVTVK